MFPSNKTLMAKRFNIKIVAKIYIFTDKREIVVYYWDIDVITAWKIITKKSKIIQ